MIFNTLQPLYLSEHEIRIEATASNADFIAFEVLVDGQMVGARLHVPPTDNKATINVKSMIHAELIALENSIVSLEETTRIRKPLECKVRAAVVSSGSTGAFTDSSTFKVMLGFDSGLHQSDWYTDFSNSRAFLTEFPNREKIAIDQPQFLTFFNYANHSNGQIYIEAIGLYSDGTQQTETINVDSLDLYDSLIINTNAQKLGLVTDELMRYEVCVKFMPIPIAIGSATTETRLSEVWYYQIYTTPDHYKDLLFFNDWYAPTVIRLTGSWTNTFQTDYVRYQSGAGINQTTKDTRDIFTGKSGFVSKDVSRAMRHLYRRGKCFLLLIDMVQLLVLDKKKWNIENAFKFLYVINLVMTAGSEPILTANKALFVNGVVDVPSDGTPPPSEDPPLEEETE